MVIVNHLIMTSTTLKLNWDEYNAFSNHIRYLGNFSKLKIHMPKIIIIIINFIYIYILFGTKVPKPPNHPHHLGWAYKRERFIRLTTHGGLPL
jgi:thiosulfate reductase cytochrome b subunit